MIAGKKFFEIFYSLVLFFMFLPAFHFLLGSRTYRVFFIFLIPFWIMVILAKKIQLVDKLYTLYKRTPFKIICMFFGYIFIQTAILAAFKIYSPLKAVSYIAQLLILYILPSFLLSAFIVPKHFSLEKLIKFITSAFFAIFIFGIFEYIGKIFSITPIIAIQQFLANERFLLDVGDTYNRLQSVFAEPGWLGAFLFVLFPIIYSLGTSKKPIYENKKINNIIQKSLIPLAWINMLLTFSPIWLIFCIIQALWIYKKQIIILFFRLKSFIVIFSIFVVVLIIVVVMLNDTSLEYNQILRIVNFLLNLNSFDAFVLAEPSLGTRVLSYNYLLHLFAQYPILGIGYGNSAQKLIPIIANSDLTMTMEMSTRFIHGFQRGFVQINIATFYTLLSETGLIGTILFYTFIFKNISFIKKIRQQINDNLIYNFAAGVEGCLFAFIFGTFYDIYLNNPIWWFLFGLPISFYVYSKLQNRSETIDE